MDHLFASLYARNFMGAFDVVDFNELNVKRNIIHPSTFHLFEFGALFVMLCVMI